MIRPHLALATLLGLAASAAAADPSPAPPRAPLARKEAHKTVLHGDTLVDDYYWLRNKVMLNKLKELRYRFAFVVAETAGARSEDVKSIFDEVIGTLGDEYWEKMFNRAVPAGRGNGSSDRAHKSGDVGSASKPS